MKRRRRELLKELVKTLLLYSVLCAAGIYFVFTILLKLYFMY